MKHHTNPAFYLSPWGSPNVCEMKLINGRVAVKWPHPNATGFVVDLYKTDGVPDHLAQRLEEHFMSPLDNDASTALAIMLQGGDGTLDSRRRSAWTRFIISLLYRHRECVEMIKSHMATLVTEATIALEPHWATHRQPGSPLTLAEATATREPGMAGIYASKLIADIINSEDTAGPDIFKMHWGCLDVSAAKFRLLTSDRPVFMPLGLSHPDAHIAVPISPNRLFIAAYDDRFARRLPTVNQTSVVKVMNKAIVSQARQYVWAADDAQIEFVRKYIGKAPDRELLTDAQKQEAVDAARGITA